MKCTCPMCINLTKSAMTVCERWNERRNYLTSKLNEDLKKVELLLLNFHGMACSFKCIFGWIKNSLIGNIEPTNAFDLSILLSLPFLMSNLESAFLLGTFFIFLKHLFFFKGIIPKSLYESKKILLEMYKCICSLRSRPSGRTRDHLGAQYLDQFNNLFVCLLVCFQSPTH